MIIELDPIPYEISSSRNVVCTMMDFDAHFGSHVLAQRFISVRLLKCTQFLCKYMDESEKRERIYIKFAVKSRLYGYFPIVFIWLQIFLWLGGLIINSVIRKTNYLTFTSSLQMILILLDLHLLKQSKLVLCQVEDLTL